MCYDQLKQKCQRCLLCFLFCFYDFLQVNIDLWRQQELTKLLNECDRQENGCILWLKGSGIYGRKSIRYPNSGASTREYVHRLSYKLSNHVFELPKNVEVSHLCHTHRCVQPSHLTLESHETNQERIHCVQQHFCTNSHFPPCKF